LKRLAVIVAAALGAFAIYTVTAPAGQQSVPTRLSAVEKKVKTLQTNVNAIKRCLAEAVPVTRYAGYVYVPQGTTTPVSTTALDVTEQGGQIQFLLLGTRAECVSTLNLKTAGPAARHAYRK
jgi:hypothetical protein